MCEQDHARRPLCLVLTPSEAVQALGCSRNFITDMAFTSATITVFQDTNANGTFEPAELVLTVHCTFSPATSDGSVPASGFTCV
jgi:hypothetical protein